jgi:signal transduction histidine kinase
MLDLALLLLTTSVLGILGLTVLLRDARDSISRLFVFLSSMAILWSVANYLTNHISGHDAQLFANRLSLAVGFLLIQAVWLMSLNFPVKSYSHSLQKRLSAIITAPIFLVTLLTSGVVSGVTFQPDKNITDITTGGFYGFYVITAAVFFIFIINNFLKAYHSKKINVLQRQQIVYAATGLLLSFLWALMVAAIIPSATNNWEISKYGPVGTLFMVAFFSVAIIRHKLFDIKLVIARSLAYVLSLVTIVLIFTAATYGISSVVFRNSEATSAEVKGLYTVLAVILAISFAPTKKFFDRNTSRIFYRDAYDPQLFLDHLNNVLVNNIQLEPLLKKSTAVIEESIKSQFTLVGVSRNNEHPKISGTTESKISPEDIQSIHHDLLKVNQRVIITDRLGDKHSEIKSVLNKNDIAIMALLRVGTGSNHNSLSYLMLGPKKSGNTYNNQDIQIIKIIADQLVIAIQNALRFEEIRNFSDTLQERVTEATKSLRRANEKLKALDETKDDFISMASHQLRTPLTSIKGYISMVLEGDAGGLNKTQKDMLWQSFISSQRMVYLIADLLNVSRLKTGKFVIEKSMINLAEVIEQELAQVEKVAEAKGVKLIYNKPKHFPELMIDDTKTRQVVMNLVDNAIYYTPAGGEISVELTDKPSTIELRVIDNGIGVPKSEQHHLFTKFYRAGNARKARPDGTGLGLFMAKKVVVAQGGAIIFESKEGKGSTFGFIFNKAKLNEPVSQPALKPVPAAEQT